MKLHLLLPKVDSEYFYKFCYHVMVQLFEYRLLGFLLNRINHTWTLKVCVIIDIMVASCSYYSEKYCPYQPTTSILNDDVWSRIISDDDAIEYETVKYQFLISIKHNLESSGKLMSHAWMSHAWGGVLERGCLCLHVGNIVGIVVVPLWYISLKRSWWGSKYHKAEAIVFMQRSPIVSAAHPTFQDASKSTTSLCNCWSALSLSLLGRRILPSRCQKH